MYATVADESKIFPIRFLKSSRKIATFTFHLSASPANPPTNF
jgi:hypothetical protein